MAKKSDVAKEFILAAERHKYVCNKILELSEFDNCKADINGIYPIVNLTIKQKQLLADSYYLTGYIIECSCCCAIYAYYPDLKKKDELDISTKDRNNTIRNVRFKKRTTTIFAVCGEGNHSLKHFADFPRFFADPAIPLLDGNTSDFMASIDLFNNYSANLRYALKQQDSTALTLHYEKVFKFYQIATKIYEGVLRTYKP